ncbi:Pkinase-domain-containing protein [Punctularia strigosozonata HHB-11173 SS5]|uniref:Pkinase-domain-containing protein n=1 Tax=Punctularia strigosozonata (strain HHB-11173) TaxID=741275 RepID=UPI00044170B9|nr:Pkinase-domain-containing protein [Punctularia strigosozonata HHB-11173 SS5]EIN05769.1 Pkinase-domain-containing protein [Punctularia strigosozonata HHB-11173 SS5]
MTKVEREIEVLRTLKHPNIVRLYDVIETDKYIGIILEYASGGELFDHILAHRYLKEKDACKLFAQLISGVWYIHQKKIVHRDLKLENLLLDRHRNVIITDFGFANRFEHRADDLMQTSCGSPCYAAPELVISEGAYVGSAVDIWSCGVILYAMLAGYLPFDDDPANPDGDNINLLYRYIVTTPLSFPEYVSAEARDLLGIMLVPDPGARADLGRVMAHPWLAPWQHLFDKSVEELERAAMEQHQMKRLAYQRQMKQAQQQAQIQAQQQQPQQQLQANGQKEKEMARSQSARPDHPANVTAPPVSARSKSTQKEQYVYETATDPVHPHASSRRGHSSAVVMPSSQPLSDDDPFAPAPAPAPAPQRHASATRKEVQAPAPASAPQPSKAKQTGSFRHTVQLEYGEQSQAGEHGQVGRSPPRPLPVPRASEERPGKHRVPSAQAVAEQIANANGAPAVKALPVVPGQERPRPERATQPPITTSQQQHQRQQQREPPVLSVENASPPPTIVPSVSVDDRGVIPIPSAENGKPLVAEREASGGSVGSRRSGHKRGISVDRLGLAKIFGEKERAPSREDVAGAQGGGEENAGWYVGRKPSRDVGGAAPAVERSPSNAGRGWYVGKRPSTLQTAPSQSGASTDGGVSPSVNTSMGSATTKPEEQLLSPGSAGKKSGRRNTLTVMVDAVRKGSRRESRRAGAETPTAEKTPVFDVPTVVGDPEKQEAASVAPPPPPAKDEHPPSSFQKDRSSVGVGMPASTNKARKVMQWFRTRSREPEDVTPTESPLQEPIAMPSTTGAAPPPPSAYVPPPAETPARTPKLSVTTPGGRHGERAATDYAPAPTPTATGFGGRFRRSVGIGGTPARDKNQQMKIHHGPVDPATITTTNDPPAVMAHVREVLEGMGLAITVEHEYKFRCVREKKKGADVERARGASIAAFTMVGSAASNGVDRRGLPVPQGSGAGGMLRGLLMRRQSSQVSTHPTPFTEMAPSAAESTVPADGSNPSLATEQEGVIETIYGDRTIDMLDEVRFSVELTRLDRLYDTYSLDIRRLKGNLRSYKFLYDTVRDRAELQQRSTS